MGHEALAGWHGALAAGRVIESQLYGFPSRDPLTLAAVVSVMLAKALVAALVPARLATRVDPTGGAEGGVGGA